MPPRAYIIRTDGACRGNPGPASIGVALYDASLPGSDDPDAMPIASISAAIGTTTNNVADAYFDVLSYRSVTGARYGTGGFNQLRGPGNDNLDLSIAKTFALTKERFKAQIRAESLNVTNTAHFANPSGTNASNMSLNPDGSLRALNGFGQITNTLALGRIIDQRFFRFSLRLLW